MGFNTVLSRDFGHWELEGIYEDKGCPVHPKCLECPLPVCVYDLDPPKRIVSGYFNRAKYHKLIQQTNSAKHFAELAGIHIVYARLLLQYYRKVNGDYAKFILEAHNVSS